MKFAIELRSPRAEVQAANTGWAACVDLRPKEASTERFRRKLLRARTDTLSIESAVSLGKPGGMSLRTRSIQPGPCEHVFHHTLHFSEPATPGVSSQCLAQISFHR